MSARQLCRRTDPLRLVRLEDRRLPAALVVTIAGEDSTPGDGNVSFREALAIANSNGQPDTITFAPGITTVAITDTAPLHVTEAGQANATTIEGGGVVVLQRDGSAGAGNVLNIDFQVFAELRGLTIAGGRAVADGGGLFVGSGADATLRAVTVRDNATTTNGGGIASYGTARLIDCTVAGNTAVVTGGGIMSKGDLVLMGSTVSANTVAGSPATAPGIGGGIAAVPEFRIVPFSPAVRLGSFHAFDSTISGNRSGGGGGGISSGVFSTLTNVTVTDNRSGTIRPEFAPGGGLWTDFGGSTKLFSTIVSGNFRGGTGTTADDVAGVLHPESNHNLIGGTARLGPLADNGGPTQTHALLPDSPALNAGSNAAAVDVNGQPLTIDQRGSPRVFDRTVDIGAYELQQTTPLTPGVVVAGSGTGQPRVNVFDPQGQLLHTFLAYAADFAGGVRVATGDVNADGVPDVITAAGPGGAPHVKAFDGTKLDLLAADGQLDPAAVLTSFFAYDRSFTGGVYVAAADVNGDGHADIVTGAGPGGGPHVRVVDGATGQENRSFYAFDAGFGGGVTVAGGDVDADGLDDIVTGAGPGGAPHVKVFGGQNYSEIRSFFAFDPAFRGGVFVAAERVADALNGQVLGQPPAGDPNAEIFVGAGPGGGPHVRIFSGATGGVYQSFYAYDGGFRGGVRVAAADLDGDGLLELVTAPGPGRAPQVKEFGSTQAEMRSCSAFDPTFLGGVFVG